MNCNQNACSKKIKKAGAIAVTSPDIDGKVLMCSDESTDEPLVISISQISKANHIIAKGYKDLINLSRKFKAYNDSSDPMDVNLYNEHYLPVLQEMVENLKDSLKKPNNVYSMLNVSREISLFKYQTMLFSKMMKEINTSFNDSGAYLRDIVIYNYITDWRENTLLIMSGKEPKKRDEE